MSVSMEIQKCRIVLTSPLPSAGLNPVFIDLGIETMPADNQYPSIFSHCTAHQISAFLHMHQSVTECSSSILYLPAQVTTKIEHNIQYGTKKNSKHCAKARKHRATVRFSSQMLPNMRSTKNMKIYMIRCRA